MAHPFNIKHQPLEIVEQPLSFLKPDPRNARKHPRQQITKLCRGIAEFGFVNPILHDEAGRIIAGHARFEAAKQLGMTHVPAIALHGLSDEQKIALALADNRIGDESSFDQAALRTLLAELGDVCFDMELTGFDQGEIDFTIDGAPGAIVDDPADRPLATGYGDVPVTREGDLWHLNQHLLLCGSALTNASFERLLQGELAQMVFTDPPYNVPIRGHVSGNGKTQHREFVQASGEMSYAEFETFLKTTCAALARHSIDGAIHYICMDWRHQGTLLAAAEGAYSEVKNLCVWAKASGGMGSLYRSQHELVTVFKSGTLPHINNVELGKHGRNRTNIWDYAGTNSFGPTRDAYLAAHPTVKPTALVADAIRDCSIEGGLILDAFCGSGTTILAAERTRRRGAGIELDPLYVDVAVRRWQALTGAKATLDRDGRTFDEIGTARQGIAAADEGAGE